jgi:hypothetical protein
MSGCFHATETWKPNKHCKKRNFEEAEEYGVSGDIVGDS